MAAGEQVLTRGAAKPRRRRLTRRGVLLGAVAAGCLRTIAARAAGEERRLILKNPNTGESLDEVYWRDGAYLAPSVRRVDWIMRDFHQGVVARIDPSLLDLLHRITGALDHQGPVQILSGYRTERTNRLLAREGYETAVHSQHLAARAADISIEGVSPSRIREAALSLAAGGVGYYPRDHFVHVDTGPVRSWTW